MPRRVLTCSWPLSSRIYQIGFPRTLEFQLFDFSVLNKLSPGAKGTSEAIEFICPRTALKQFVNAEITNQQLLDQSIILVNGVRIALNLQLVE